jgi:hypothetical protein
MDDRQMFVRGDIVDFAGINSVVRDTAERDGETVYLIENGPDRLPMWVPAAILAQHQAPDHRETEFRRRLPDVVVVDDFFHDPDEIRQIALAQEYSADLRYYKGLRSNQRFLWPYLREEFGRLLGNSVTEWLGYSANGVFQQTSYQDPLVYHHDTQQYAAAVYLTPDGPPSGGTSFWRDRVHGCRRRPTHPAERARLGSDEAVKAAESVVYDRANIGSPDGWELIEAVAGLYNRLVIWDASLIHSATSYDNFSDAGTAPSRLVQLFFFDAA